MVNHQCRVCRDTGYVPFLRTTGKMLNMPWAAACLCEKGRFLASEREWPPHRNDRKGERPEVIEPVDRELWNKKREESDEPDHPNSTPERKRAAMRYIVASFGSDPNPEIMVEEILAGRRDDVVRTIMGEKRAA